MTYQAEEIQLPVASVVLFGSPNAGKSTLVGYILSNLIGGMNLERINKDFQRKLGEDYKPDQYYAYYVDRLEEEYKRGSHSSGLGTTKVLHLKRSSFLSSDNTAGKFRIVFLDTPGSPRYERSRFRGLSYGDIGIFVFEIKKGAQWTINLPAQDEMLEGLIPLRAWLKLPSKPQTIIVLSKADNADNAVVSLDKLVAKWKKYAVDYCGSDVNTLTVIPTEIDVQNRNDGNVLTRPTNSGRYDSVSGPLIDLIKQEASRLVNTYKEEINCSPSIFVAERSFKQVKGFQKILRGKILSGFFKEDQQIRIIPAIDENKHILDDGVLAKIRSIRPVDDQFLVHHAVRGDFVGLSFTNPDTSRYTDISGTLVLDFSVPYDKGRHLQLTIENENESDLMKVLTLYNQVKVVWFGRIIPTQIIGFDKNHSHVTLETVKKTNLFVMPYNSSNNYFSSHIVLLFDNKVEPVKAQLIKVGTIRALSIHSFPSVSESNHLKIAKGESVFDNLRTSKDLADLKQATVFPVSFAWEDNNYHESPK